MGVSDPRKVSEKSRRFVPPLCMMAALLFILSFLAVNIVTETRTSGALVVVGWLAIAGLLGGSILFRVGAIARGNNKAGVGGIVLVLVSSSVIGSSFIPLTAAVFNL